MANGLSARMNGFIPNHLDDRVFFYACRIAMQSGAGWTVQVDPSACLVSLTDAGDGLPTVAQLRRDQPHKSSGGGRTTYEGRMLFSGGVILTINGKLPMLLRDEKAPVDPLKWTSPAGRCDREPLLTCLKEFYEEIIIFDRVSGRPVFVEFPGEVYEEALQAVYSRSLERKGFANDIRNWIIVQAHADDRFVGHLHEVQTCFGPGGDCAECAQEEIFPGRFLTFFDEAGSTLEMRLLAALALDPAMEARLSFLDGEYDRRVRLFSQQDFMLLKDESLVRTMSHFRKAVWPGR